MTEANNSEFLTYKGKPFVRSGAMIYYGNLSDDYYLVLQIRSSKEENGLKVADKVTVNLFKNDPSLKPNERIIHKIDKEDLYSAITIGRSWLEQAQAPKA